MGGLLTLSPALILDAGKFVVIIRLQAALVLKRNQNETYYW